MKSLRKRPGIGQLRIAAIIKNEHVVTMRCRLESYQVYHKNNKGELTMITVEEAKNIGIQACIKKLGKTFVKENAGNSSAGYGKRKNSVYCFVGVDNEKRDMSGGLLLDSVKFPYRASCDVSLENGEITFIECVAPKKN